MPIIHSRRGFLTGLFGAAAAGLVGAPARLMQSRRRKRPPFALATPAAACLAPLAIAEEFLLMTRVSPRSAIFPVPMTERRHAHGWRGRFRHAVLVRFLAPGGRRKASDGALEAFRWDATNCVPMTASKVLRICVERG